MNQQQRIAQQRVLFAEALGKLKAINDLFGMETMLSGNQVDQANNDYKTYSTKLTEFENWFYDEGPCA